MKSRILSLAIVVISTAATHAENVTPTQPYQLKRKSAFTATGEDVRAPFWPIGWVKPKAGAVSPGAVVEVPKVKLDEAAFKVTSILLGSPSLTIINGRTYSEGEFIRQPRAAGGAATVATSSVPAGLRVRVYRIDDGAVVLECQEQLLTIPLKRPELAQKRGEEDLLLEDRP